MKIIFSKSIGIKLGLLFLASILAILTIPKLDPSTEGPGIITVLGVGLVITLFTVYVIYFGVNTSLNLPKKFFLFVFLYNTLVIVVKFVLSPLSVYQVNEFINFTIIPFDELFLRMTFTITGIIVFLLYFFVFHRIYLRFKQKVEKSISQEAIAVEKTKRYKTLVFWGIALLIVLLVCLIILFNVLPILVISGLFIVFTPLISLEYIGIVFSGALSILITIALLVAIYLVTETFRSAAEQAIVLRDITILASFFWIGTAFLFIYHALWIVYMLMLTTLWPLKVVTPK